MIPYLRLPIPGFAGYEIDNRGIIYSCKLVGGNRSGLGTTWRILEGSPNKDGHLVVNLYCDLVRHTFMIHQLVMSVFVGPCPVGLECCHNDGIPSHNYVWNLRYDIRANNQADRNLHGTRNNPHRLTPAQETTVYEMVVIYRHKVTWVAKYFKINKTTVYDITKRKGVENVHAY